MGRDYQFLLHYYHDVVVEHEHKGFIFLTVKKGCRNNKVYVNFLGCLSINEPYHKFNICEVEGKYLSYLSAGDI